MILLTDDHSPEKLDATLQAFLEANQNIASIQTIHFDEFEFETFAVQQGDSLILLSLSDQNLKNFLNQFDRPVKIGLLPHPDAPLSAKRFHIPAKLSNALEAIFSDESPKIIDNFFCNQQLVLGSVLIGDRQSMEPAAKVQQGFWARIVYLWGMIVHMVRSQPFLLTLTTDKNSQIQTAAKSLSMVYQPEQNAFTHRVVANGEQSEPNLHTVIFAPRSISEIWNFALTRILPSKTKVLNLPSYLGHVKTQSLQLEFPKSVEIRIDYETCEQAQVECEVKPTQIQICNTELPAGRVSDPKESFRVSHLPKGKLITSLVSRELPWIYHSDPEEVKETFISLKESAKLSPPYLVLMALSVLLATVGLFANSAPVIIGAMILAPLMAPIISLSMGVLRQETELTITSSRTLLFGILLALFGATLFSWLMPLQALNSEISARLSPTILDLAVAIIAGIAGAYANAKSEVAKSLAGVAIAVALVPPLAVSGIGIGWWDWHVFSGAFLLFLTNLVGIVLAAAATFLVLGFSPLHLAKKGLMMTTFVVILVSIPLSIAFYSMVQEQRMVTALESQPISLLSTDATIREVRILRGKPLRVSLTLLSEQTLTAYEIDQIQQQIEKRLGQSVELEAHLAIVR
ncbi:TIGR00341 family protein [Thiomicrorhabdus indica]|uniref:TIGR00341 family protein n=1 Tax=Thiomicrorhabdus indica TaxID=2267253 RepID=UPI00102DB27D|nr:TIGR00341 family protein [Thiomicrorhabdus indica]